jgi:hypothetical protein
VSEDVAPVLLGKIEDRVSEQTSIVLRKHVIHDSG